MPPSSTQRAILKSPDEQAANSWQQIVPDHLQANVVRRRVQAIIILKLQPLDTAYDPASQEHLQ